MTCQVVQISSILNCLSVLNVWATQFTSHYHLFVKVKASFYVLFNSRGHIRTGQQYFPHVAKALIETPENRGKN